MIRLSLVSVGMVEETGGVVLVLRAPERERLLVMQVGLLEGRAIALEAEGVKAPRPLTHHLAQRIIEGLGARIDHVLIRDFKDQTFFANLVLKQADGRLVEIDCRPSDAIAVALSSEAPLFATAEVIESAGLDESLEDGLEEPEADEDDDEDDGEETIIH